ncbi:MAG TPA: ATP-binding protein [Paludibaculum sp.]
MPYRLGPKLMLSLTILIVLISTATAYYNLRSQKRMLVETMVLGADQLSRGITSATWHAMLADNRDSAYEIMQVIAHKQGMDRIRIFNREGRLMYSTDTTEKSSVEQIQSEVCRGCHEKGVVKSNLDVNARVRFANSPTGSRTLSMVTPVYNETACSNATCHAHPANLKVLGVLDVALRLDPVDAQERALTMQSVTSTAIVISIGAIFVFIFTRLFVATPIRELIEGTKAVSAMELDRPIEIHHGSQEFDELVDSFNKMRVQLQTALAELNELAQNLETKVADRTSQLKVAQQRLLHTDRLTSLGQLAASVAHEINNPVSGVLNLSMLLQRIMGEGGIPPGREAEFRKYLGQISGETARVGRIVSDLLSFSRRSKPQRASADLNKLIETTVALVGHKLKMIDSVAVLDLQADLPTVECDPSQMQQVMLNLVLNAAESMQSKGGGQVTVRTRFNASDQHVEISIEDNGEGISAANLDKIFDPFFTTKADGKGVGLGLAVLYGIVKAHDGEVEVRSTPGMGSTFLVTLPRHSNHSPATTAPPGATV